jgi:L-ascorbate metabolism protein UlaG (beta-lactamase superfamily)
MQALFAGNISRSFAALALAIAATCAATFQGFAQSPAAPARPEVKEEFCPGLVASTQPRVTPASFTLAALAADQVRITFIGHATFLIESPHLVRIATDYNDYVRSPLLPDIITMNHAHSTHYTDFPDPAIKHVLRGWRDDGTPAKIDLTYNDVHIRNVPTNIRNWNGGTEKYGNSIFVFEVGSLCVAHLGHIHHTLTQQQLNDLGRVDVLMVPVDGSWTLDLDGMIEVVQSIKAPLMIPMHYFSTSTLNRFLDRVRDKYQIDYSDTPSIVVSRGTLPNTPKFLVLPGH